MKYGLGIVLSGGGARGVAHIGVLKALTEAGIEPDCLAATSAGAIVAALYSAGYTAEEMLEFFIHKNPFRFSRVTLAKPGIFDSEKVLADFKEYLPDDSFEALERPIFLTATDLLEARPEIFAAGRLIPAILASASTPLVFSPTEFEGHWYSDGGITNNFPVEPLIGHCDVILGVYASPLRPIREEDLRTSLAVSHRAFEIGMYQASRRKFHECDLVLCPEDLAQFSPLDTKHMKAILDTGYRAACDRIEEILGLVARLDG